MPKRSLNENIQRGYLSVPNAAALCDVSTKTIAKWLDSGLVLCIEIPGNRERRIVPHSLIKLLTDAGLPVDPKIHEADRIYRALYVGTFEKPTANAGN